MKIVAPIVNVGEIEVLANAGANEFYCGFVPDDWGTRFRAANLNQRPSDNFCSYAELAQAVRVAHQCDCSLALVLNAQSYTDEQGDALVSIANSFLDMGGDALIVSDLALIAELYEHVPLRRIHISSVATCRTHSAAWFCKELGASRLILPRDVTIDEACEIASEVPGLEVETLILNDAWMPRRLGGPIGMDNYANRCRRRSGGHSNESFVDRPRENDREYKKWLWSRFSCGLTTNEAGMPFGPCGLCALPALLSGGIAAVKIAGRAAPTARKQASVRMVRAVLDQIEAGERSKQVMRFAQALRPSVEHCRTGYMCNYPEVLKQ
jgi:U32 family peptidase